VPVGGAESAAMTSRSPVDAEAIARAALATPQPALEAALAEALTEVAAMVTTRLGDELVSLALWGSLSRGEGRWVWEGSQPRFLSDLDLYVLVRRGARHTRQLARDLRDVMARRGLELELYIRPAWQMRHGVRPTVLSELRHTGALLAGVPLARVVPEPSPRRFHVGQGCRRLYSFARKAMVAAAARSPHLAALPAEAAKLAGVTADFLTMSQGAYYPRLTDKVTRGAAVAVDTLGLPPAVVAPLLAAPDALRVVQPGDVEVGRLWAQVWQALVATLQTVLAPGQDEAIVADLTDAMRRQARRAHGGGPRRVLSALRFRRGVRRGLLTPGTPFRLSAHEDALDAALLLLDCLGEAPDPRSAAWAAEHLRRAGVDVPDLPAAELARHCTETIGRLDAAGML
jgi:hypothetical protein